MTQQNRRTPSSLRQADRHTRPKDDTIYAALEDYATVRELMADLLGHGVGAAVPPEVRVVVNAVRHAKELSGYERVGLSVLEGVTKMTTPSLSRWVTQAARHGYLVNEERRKGMPANLEIGSRSMPDEDTDILPTVEAMRERYQQSEHYQWFEQ